MGDVMRALKSSVVAVMQHEDGRPADQWAAGEKGVLTARHSSESWNLTAFFDGITCLTKKNEIPAFAGMTKKRYAAAAFGPCVASRCNSGRARSSALV
jgi:hypothetical protein